MHGHIKRGRIRQALLVVIATLVLLVWSGCYERQEENDTNFNTVIISSGEFPDISISHEEELVIPGLEGEYDLLLLADLHMVIKTREDAGAYGVSADERIAFFSNEKGTPSAEHLPQWVSYANRESFDAVLMLGDMIDYYTEETSDYLSKEVAALEMPYLFTIGNHEFFSPWYESIPENSTLRGLFRDGKTAFQMLDFDEFMVCAIDNNPYQVESDSFWGLYEAIVANPGKPVILLAHVPFYTEYDKELLKKSTEAWGEALVIGTGEGTRDTTQVSRDFLNYILGEESPVVAIFAGDNHFYHKGNLNDSVTQWVVAPAFAGDGMIVRVRGN